MPSSSVELVGIPASDIPDIWPVAKKLLEPAIERSLGRYSAQTVLEALLKRDMQLWLAVDERILAAATTRINCWPTGLKTARVVLAAGSEVRKWVHLIDGLEEWAQSHGCQLLEAEGRPGWERVLKWEKTAVELVKDLSDARWRRR